MLSAFLCCSVVIFHTHDGANALVHQRQILDGHGHSIGFLCFYDRSILILRGDSAGAFFAGDEVVHELPTVLLTQTFRAEAQSIKTALTRILSRSFSSFVCSLIPAIASFSRPDAKKLLPKQKKDKTEAVNT